MISCDPYKFIMVHGLQIHFNFSVFPIVVMLLFLFYGCKDTTKLCQIVAWQRRKETLFPNLFCIKDKTTPLENGRQSLKNGHGACPCWARCLPRLGNVLAPVGHGCCPKCAQNVGASAIINPCKSDCQKGIKKGRICFAT